MNPNDEAFYRVSIKGLLINTEGKTLLVKEHDGRWELPGGGLKHGENIKETLCRELKEELGVEVSWIDERPCYCWTQQREKDGMIYHCLFLGYVIRTSSDAFSFTSDEAVEAAYFSGEEMQALSIHPNLTNFIQLMLK
jgi:8-oxo-dGTP diphosphatase